MKGLLIVTFVDPARPNRCPPRIAPTFIDEKITRVEPELSPCFPVEGHLWKIVGANLSPLNIEHPDVRPQMVSGNLDSIEHLAQLDVVARTYGRNLPMSRDFSQPRDAGIFLWGV